METIAVRNLTFTYPKQAEPALKDVTMEIPQGQFVVLCGKSGCGKSTLLKHFRGNLVPHGVRSGEVCFNGKAIESMDLREQAETIGFVQQSPDNQIVTDKVWHELAFGLESLGCKTEEIRGRVSEMASFFGIQTWFHKKVTELSGGQKQLLNLAAVMVMQPKLLILDEPTSQLDPIAAADFLETIKKVNRELGTTILLTEHRLEEALPLSDRVIVMDCGEIIADGTPKQAGARLKELSHDMFTAMPTPMRIYAAVENNLECPITVKDGREWVTAMAEAKSATGEFDPMAGVEEAIKAAEQRKLRAESQKPLIELDEVWFRYEREQPDIVKGLTMNINKGELFALVGGNGTGKTTSLSVLGGLLKPYRGTVKINGEKITARDIPQAGIGILPQNPQTLFVKKNVELDLYEMFSGRHIAKAEQYARVERVKRLCELENLAEMHPYDLSGGEQQRAALAKVLLMQPQILLLDEPTKGLDGYFKEKIAAIFTELKKSGTTIVMVSHDIEFCAAHADRCAMFFDGKITGIDEPGTFFKGKSFYTTAANRMARSVLSEAVLAEDVIAAFGGKLPEKNDELPEGLDGESNDGGSHDGHFPGNDGDSGNGYGSASGEGNGKDGSDDDASSANGSNEKAASVKVPGRKKITLRRKIIAGGCFAVFAGLWAFLLGKYVDFRDYLVQFSMVLMLGGGLVSLFPGNNIDRPDHSVQVERDKRKLSKRTIAAMAMVLLAIPLTIFIGVFYLQDRKYYFISLLIIIEAMIPFAMAFESKKPQARELMIIAVLCAMAVAGRAAFFMLPQFKPVIAIVIISGVCFGGEAGFLVGALTAFLSNMMFGQGPLTPWQMFAYGICGLFAGIFFQKGLLQKKKNSLCIFGALIAFSICGLILDTGSCLAWQANPNWPILLTYYITGVPFNVIHAFATAFFLWFIAEPMVEKLERIKTKYGLIEI